MRYKNVIFDLDGTIIDSQLGIAKGFQSALKAYGVEEDIEVIKGLIGPPLSRTIITKYGFSEEDGAAAMKIHMQYCREIGVYEGSIYDGVIEMLDTLKEKGATVTIATNKPEELALLQMEHLKLKDYFKVIIGNNITQTRGNKSDFVRMAMEEAGFNDKENTIMIGDRYHDIDGGKDNNLDTIGVLYGYGSEEEMRGCNPTYIAKTPGDVTKIILGE